MLLISAGRFITVLAVFGNYFSFLIELEVIVYPRNYLICEEPWIVLEEHSPLSSSKKLVGETRRSILLRFPLEPF